MYVVDDNATVERLGSVLEMKDELRRYLDNMVMPEVWGEMHPNERQVTFIVLIRIRTICTTNIYVVRPRCIIMI